MTTKRILLSLVKRLPGAGLISIAPVTVEPRIAGLVNGWIYDPELCDLDAAALDREPSPEIAALHDRADGRMLVTALGRQSEDKGFGFFCTVWIDCPDVREHCLFVAAGKVQAELTGPAARFVEEGGVLIDSRISDARLLDLYAVSDAIWCCYAPEYDQASGIFGRAVQFAKTAVVRKGSHVERFAAVIEHNVRSIHWGDNTSAAEAFGSLAPASNCSRERGTRNGVMEAHNREVFLRYLG